MLCTLLAVTGLTATGIVTAAPAQAAAGDPFPAADPYVYIAQNIPTGLFKAMTDPSGTVTFSAEGATSTITYNAIAYNTADNYIYAIAGNGNVATPSGSLIRIGQNGAYTRVGVATYSLTNSATFGADGLYYSVTTGGTISLQVINVATGAVVRTTPLSGAALPAADITLKNGFLWTMGAGFFGRTNPATGATVRFPIPFATSATDQAGAAWTFGNGNLGFSFNGSGTVYQVAVTNPGSANPTLTLVSTNAGPSTSNNDGTSSPGQPTDLSVTKTGPVALVPGGTATYSITVTNNGPGNSSGYSVHDVVPAALTAVASASPGCTVTGNTVNCAGGRLLAGDSVTYSVTAAVPAGIATAPVTNTATVTPNEADPNNTNNTSSTTGNPTNISIVKHAGVPVDVNADGLVDAGDTIDFTFTVTNTGLVALSSIAVSDPKVGAVTCPPGALAPGGSTSCTADSPYTITAADVTAGAVDNSATASGVPQGETDPIVSSPSTTHTPTTAPAPAVSIVKSASPSDAASYTVGQVITYTFVVTNTGNVPLTGVTIDDSVFSGSGALTAIACPAGADTLAAGEQVSCTASYTLSQVDVDAGSVTNSATVTGTPPEGPVVTTPPSEAQIPVDPAPAISLVKSATPPTALRAGDTITYSFRVTNTGNVTLTDPSITETAFSGTGAVPVASCPAGPVEPGQAITCTATYTVTQADVDAGEINNSATTTGTPPGGTAPPVSPGSQVRVVVPHEPAVTMVKTANVRTVTRVGDRITYTFTVTNTGNVTVGGLSITEGAFTGTGTLSTPDCPALPAGLAPGATVECHATYTVVAADLAGASLVNTATATVTPPGGDPITSPPSTATVTDDPLTAPAGELAATGSPIGWGLGGLAAALLAIGGALTLARRRPRES